MANQNFAKTAGFHSAGHKYGEKCDKYLNLAIYRTAEVMERQD